MRAATAVFATTMFAANVAKAQESLTLPTVLKSASRHHPRIASALSSQRAAEGELLAANGGFDPRLDVYSALTTGGYYDLIRLNVEVRQPTPFWGSELWTGYRLGLGLDESRYPTYDSDQTLQNGEFRAGIRIPVWRNGPMDEARAAKRTAEQRLDGATARRHATRAELLQAATDAYFAWVAAGRRVRVAEDLRLLALRRQRWVRARAASGAIAAVEVLEAERAVLQRERAAAAARRLLQQTSLALALFVRQDDGAPRRPLVRELPSKIPPPSNLPSNLAATIDRARQCHPQLTALRADLRAARTALELARGQNGPQVDIQGQVSRDIGDGGVSLTGTVFEAGLMFSMPLAMRQPRGRVRAAESRVVALEQEIRLVEDSIRVRILDAASAFANAEEQRSVALRLMDNTKALAEAERTRFEAGATELFVVNLREQSISEAELALIDSLRAAWQARAQWDFLASCAAGDSEHGDPNL